MKTLSHSRLFAVGLGIAMLGTVFAARAAVGPPFVSAGATTASQSRLLIGSPFVPSYAAAYAPKGAALNRGAAVSLNPQPLPPKGRGR